LTFLADFLTDKTLRELPENGDRENSKYQGDCAAVTFKRVTVRDFAAERIASILHLPDHPRASWTAAQWTALRKEVELRLTEEELPQP